MVRFLTLPVAWRWGLVVVGLLLAIGGGILTYVATSLNPQGTGVYRSVRGTVQFTSWFTGSGRDGPVTLYSVTLTNQQTYSYNPGDFTPILTADDLQFPQVVFIYRPDKKVSSINDLVQVTVFDSSGQTRVFTTAEYTQYVRANQAVQANQESRLAIGITVLIVGLLIAALAFALPIIVGPLGKNKKQAALNVAPSVAMGTPIAMQPQTDPYPQSKELQQSD